MYVDVDGSDLEGTIKIAGRSARRSSQPLRLIFDHNTIKDCNPVRNMRITRVAAIGDSVRSSMENVLRGLAIQ